MTKSASSSVRRFARSSAIMAVLYAVAVATAFLVGVILTRQLGAHGFGIYSLALTTATLIGLVTEFGLPTLAMREAGSARASGAWGELRGLMAWSDRAVMGLSLVLIAGTYAVLSWRSGAEDSDYLQTMMWAVLLVPLVALAKLRSSVLLALDHVAAGQFAVMILRPLVFLALCLAIPLFTPTMTASQAMLAQLGGAAASLAVVAVLYRRWKPASLASVPAQYKARSWLSVSLPMGVTEGLRLLQGQIALLLVGWLGSAAAAGIYRVADAVMQLATVVASIVATAATPMFGRLAGEGDHDGLERIAVLSAVIMAGGALVIGLPIALFGHLIFPLVFSAEFAASAPIFVVLWIGIVATYCMGLGNAIANMIGHHVLTTQAFLVTAIINLVVGLVLIPSFGALGAALATAVSGTTGAALSAWSLYRRTGLNPTVFNASAPGILLGYGRMAISAISGRIERK